MDIKPCAVIASSTDTCADDIIKLILGVGELPVPTLLIDGIKAYPWHIDTKYYTADVNLCAVDKKTLANQEFAISVEAVVIKFDSNKDDALSVVDGWLTFLKEFEPEVQILLCDRCEENPSVGVPRIKVQEWCVDRGFELVEINPEVDAEWEEDQDFIETTGIKRVVQAMHAHLWPNLHMKDKPQHLSRTIQSMLNGNSLGDFDSAVSNLGKDLQDVQINDSESQSNNASARRIEETLDELLGDSGEVAGFSSLFEQLHSMKEHVQGLPVDERKSCAEKVVMAFWKAIGGDDDEIGDLDMPDV